jgi:molybdopterin-biosynthesis enzyme MoeA-like protein
VIGDEILSGRTKDKNIGYIAEYLTNIGIDLKEVRVVADRGRDRRGARRAAHRYTYVFTTGGIGPTHDDITADCVAKAFGVDRRSARWRALCERIAEKDEMNEARLRMARIPAGADLILNKVSAAPGFDRQRHRDGGRAVDHAGDARRGRAEAEDRLGSRLITNN